MRNLRVKDYLFCLYIQQVLYIY